MVEERKTIVLKYPIESKSKNGGDISISEIKIGRFKLGHMKLLPKNFAKRAKGKKGDEITLEPHELIPIIAALSGLGKEEVDKIDLDDLDQIGEVIGSFFESSPGTGKKSSGQSQVVFTSNQVKSGK